MFIALWSAKGGAGTTVSAVTLAMATATIGSDDGEGSRPLLVDMGGDCPAALGLTGEHPGVADWSRAGIGARPDALSRLIVPGPSGIDLLPRGNGVIDRGRMAVLVQVLASAVRPIIIDVGRPDLDPAADSLVTEVEAVGRSILVTRCCYLSLRRAMHGPWRPTAAIVVAEAGRALSAADVSSVLGLPVLATFESDPAVARGVDAGVLARPPRRHMGVATRAVVTLGGLERVRA